MKSKLLVLRTRKITFSTRMSFLAVECLIVAAMAGCASNQSVRESIEVMTRSGLAGDNPELSSYIIKLKDQIRITLPEYHEFDTTATVGESGTIKLKLIGEIPALGLTKAQLAKNLVTRYSVYTKDAISVVLFIANKQIETITVLGNVGRQGVFPAPPDGSLLTIIATAGGPAQDSDLRHVKIFHRNDLIHPVEVDLTLTLNVEGTESTLPTAGPGDTIYVPKEENVLRDLSNFFRDTFFLFSLLTIIR